MAAAMAAVKAPVLAAARGLLLAGGAEAVAEAMQREQDAGSALRKGNQAAARGTST